MFWRYFLLKRQVCFTDDAFIGLFKNCKQLKYKLGFTFKFLYKIIFENKRFFFNWTENTQK